MICLGKALTGGFPLSACVGRADVMDAAWPRSTGEAIHTSTFLGHPVGCAMALAQIKEIQTRRLPERSAALGAFLLRELRAKPPPSPWQFEIRGLGLMAGVEIRQPDGAPATAAALGVIREMLRAGYIVLPEGEHSNVISFHPAPDHHPVPTRRRRARLPPSPQISACPMTLTDIRDILSERDLKLSKSLGQNFLHDQNQVRRIVAAAEAGPGDKILEIGPGLGPLTEALLQQGCDVLAIEKDKRLFDFLQHKFAAATHLQLLRDDALDYVKTHRSWGGWKLVSNLPYSVGSTILVELAQAENPPERMVGHPANRSRRAGRGRGRKRALRNPRPAPATALSIRRLVQNPTLLLFPGAGGGQRLYHPHPAARSPAPTRMAPPLYRPRQTRLFPAPENDVQTP